jgi:hypothetical protein
MGYLQVWGFGEEEQTGKRQPTINLHQQRYEMNQGNANILLCIYERFDI